jgi:hypothetical protein
MAAPSASVSLNSQKVTNLATPTSSSDASTKGYVDTQITNLIGTAPSTLDTLQEIATAINNDAGLYTTLNNGKLNRDGTQAMTGALPMGTFKITGLGDPTNAQDAATKNYVDTGAASQVAAAAASATAAAASASAADASATSASGSATSATASASSATSSASSATASASAASTSATNASNSATAASNSASTASTQATNAANSASAAATSASNAATSESNAATSATNAAASFDSFDDRYLGSKSSAPSVDNDGNTLATGALYWNSTDNTMYVWSGTAWGSISSTAAIFRYRYSATASQTTFTGADADGATLSYLVGKEQVYLNGVLQVRGTDYTATNGTSIVLASGAAASDVLEIITFTAFSVILSAMTDVQNTFVFDQIINGVKVGEGGGSLATNTALGAAALNSNTTGNNATAIGQNALTANTIGQGNVAVGTDSLKANTTSGFNTAVGALTLLANTEGGQHTAIGYSVLRANTTGYNNTGVGYAAMRFNTTGYNNTAVGNSALFQNTTGYANAAIGLNALYANTTGTENTAVGASALGAVTTGSNNVAIGANSLATSTAHDNIAIGSAVLYANTTGTRNVGIGGGIYAGDYPALRMNTVGVDNTAVGNRALAYNTTGNSNTAIGSAALRVNTTGIANTAVGTSALNANTTGQSNIGMGYLTLNSNTTGFANIAIGGEYASNFSAALQNNVTGSRNTAVGIGAAGQTTANDNTVIGYGAANSMTTGFANTVMGAFAGQTGTNNLTTGSNNTIIGYQATVSGATVSNTVTLGNSAIATLRCQVTSITALSDARDKKNIQPLSVGLDFVKTLNPVTFDWNMRDGGKVDIPDTGFIAQELMAAEDAVEMADKLQLTYRDNPEKLEATQGRLIPILVKAIQELAAEVELLKGAK